MTYVTFDDLRIAKGRVAGQEITIAMSGGTVDSITTFVVDQPTFTVGQRYVVLVYESLGSAADGYLPIVGLNQGFFPVKKSASGELSVRDWKDREVVGIRDRHLVVLGRGVDATSGTIGPKKVDRQGDEAEFKKPRVDTRDPEMRKRARHPVPRVFVPNGRPDSIAAGRAKPEADVVALNAQLLSENRVPLEIVGPKNDPHSRMSEGELLITIQRLAGSR